MSNPRYSQSTRVTRGFVRPIATLSFITVIIFGCAVAQAEFVVSLFTGSAMTENSDVHLRQPGGTSLTFHDARFKGRSFEPAPYYGGRLAYFLYREKSGFGFGIEYFHAKAYLQTGDIVHVTGTRGGVPVNDNEPISDTIQSFNNAFGMNFITADVLYRLVFAGRDKSFLGRIQPYAGVGLGIAVPHVQSTVGGINFSENQIHGPAVQALGGLNFDITRRWSIFGEYKFTYIDLDEKIPGGSIHYEPHTHHLVGGISFHF